MSENDRRNIVGIEHDRVTNVASTDLPGHYPGEDLSWNLEKFKQQFDIDIYNLGQVNANFDLKGVDTSVANAFRRIMIAEIPTVAFESVYIFNNTSIIVDEVLAQRIGLIPLKVDADWLQWYVPASEERDAEGNLQSAHTSLNTIQFNLKVKCERNKNAAKGETDPDKLYINHKVYAKDLKFEPIGEQESYFTYTPEVVNPDILIAKLRPGQEISLTALAILGMGNDHAKFSPVATASYRLLPVIDIIGEPIKGDLAKKFQSCFPEEVIEIDRKGEAYVSEARKDTVSREVLRHDEFKGRVKLGRKRDHFIFNIESAGAIEPDEIFVKSIMNLKMKAQELLAYELE